MMNAPFDPARAFTSFASHGVNFVTIGGVAAMTWGADIRMMPVLEVCCERSTPNIAALADALNELEASVRGAPSDDSKILNIAMIETHDVLRLNTNAGAVDCVATPSGTTGYSDLIKSAVHVDLGDGVIARVASLGDLVRIARAADSPQGRALAEILSVVQEERRLP